MKLRGISLMVLTLVVATAPAAMASHCLRCRPDLQTCVTASNYGFVVCDWDPVTGECFTENFCGNHAAPAMEPLASEFIVASVERLDETQPATAEGLVASHSNTGLPGSDRSHR